MSIKKLGNNNMEIDFEMMILLKIQQEVKKIQPSKNLFIQRMYQLNIYSSHPYTYLDDVELKTGTCNKGFRGKARFYPPHKFSFLFQLFKRILKYPMLVLELERLTLAITDFDQ